MKFQLPEPTQPGIIKHPSLIRRVLLFHGLRFGNISPSDIDAVLDFKGRLVVFIEAKFSKANVPFGQELLLERLCDWINSPPKRRATVLIAAHASDGDVDLATCELSAYRWNCRWRSPRETITIHDAIFSLIGKFT